MEDGIMGMEKELEIPRHMHVQYMEDLIRILFPVADIVHLVPIDQEEDGGN